MVATLPVKFIDNAQLYSKRSAFGCTTNFWEREPWILSESGLQLNVNNTCALKMLTCIILRRYGDIHRGVEWMRWGERVRWLGRITIWAFQRFRKSLLEVHYRLCSSRSLQVNTSISAFFKLYKLVTGFPVTKCVATIFLSIFRMWQILVASSHRMRGVFSSLASLDQTGF